MPVTKGLRAVVALVLVLASPVARARDAGGTKADAERAVQAFLAIWGSRGSFDATSVARFYAPRVVYYGKTFTRAQVLADKRAYTRAWPVRHYREVPGSFTGRCDAGRTLCKVGIVMAWRRVAATGRVSTGRARLEFDFVPIDGGRKIARERATILQGDG